MIITLFYNVQFFGIIVIVNPLTNKEIPFMVMERGQMKTSLSIQKEFKNLKNIH